MFGILLGGFKDVGAVFSEVLDFKEVLVSVACLFVVLIFVVLAKLHFRLVLLYAGGKKLLIIAFGGWVLLLLAIAVAAG